MSGIVPFQFESHEVRAIERDGDPWFILTDVCRVLDIANPSQAAGRLDDDERGLCQIDTPGGMQSIIIVNEPGLYRLVMRSDKPQAKRFQKWVFAEVLPALRKTGKYEVGQGKSVSQYDWMRSVVDGLEENAKRLDKHEAQIQALGAHEDYRSIKAYAALIGRKITTKQSGELGKQATAISKQLGHKIGRMPDDAFGQVNTYHRDVLKQVFGQ